MGADSEWHNVVRVAWSTGGIVAVNEPGPEVRIQAGFCGPTVRTLCISDFKGLFASLREGGFPTIGATFAQHREEFEGLRPPQFLAMSRAMDRWLVWDARQVWRQIAVAAGRANHMRLLDVASRVASGLAYSELRLSDLVNSYGVQLRGHFRAEKEKDYEAFNDLNSFAVYKGIHALFWELAVLRDSLAEFVASFCFPAGELRSMAGLRKFLLRNPPADELAAEILQVTDPASGGWIATFSAYRDLFTHLAPLQEAAGKAFAVQDLLKVPSGSPVPQIFYALPSDVAELARKRSKGTLFNSLEELAAASARKHDRRCEPDALEYLHGCIDDFAKLALKLVPRSPVAPRPIRIGPEDLVGPVQVK